MTDTANWLDRYQPWRRSAEIGFWVVAFLVNAVFNSLTVLMDVQRSHLDFASWKPPVWETSSGLVILLLVPAVVLFTRRFPLHRDTWRRHLPWYLPASLVWSLAHVLGIFFAILGPLIIMLTKGEQSRFVKHHAVEALNFSITVMIASLEDSTTALNSRSRSV